MRTPRSIPSSLFRHSPLAAALACVLATPAIGATFTVTNSNTFGPGSLNQAIQDANAGCSGADVINFDAPYIIAASAPLPLITCGGLEINGAAAGTKSVVEGGGVFFEACGITGAASPNAIIRNLEVRNFSYGFYSSAVCGDLTVLGSDLHGNSRGVTTTASTLVGDGTFAGRNRIFGNTESGVLVQYGGVIDNNWIGTVDGTTSSGQWIGVEAQSGATIRNNLISGNFIGVYAASSGITIANNSIGLNEVGNGSIPNVYGINTSNAGGVVISGNVISGNGDAGIAVDNTSNAQIVSNKIGTDAAGAAAIPNGNGISIYCSPSPSVLGNVISGNQYGGVFMGSVDAGTLQGNKIGVAIDGATLMGNNGDGLFLGFGECGFKAKASIINGSNANLIESNTIAGNSGSGVRVDQGGDNTIRSNTIKANLSHGASIVQGTGNRITANSIEANGGKNIDLDFSGGPLDNDSLDVDGDPPGTPRPNNWQNKPAISLVIQSGGNTSVTWSLASAASKAYQVEIFSNSGSGTPAGKTLIATVPVTTDASGNYSETTVISGPWDNVSASAIDQATNDTSEFSGALALTPTPEVAMNPISGTLSFANTVVGASSGSQPVTLTSVGTASYVINAFTDAATCEGGPICSSGAFICANSCSPATPYAPSSSCSVNVTFSPSVLGPASETFHICDNAPGTPRSVTLTGTGIAPPPPTVAPASHSFGSFQVGTFSAPHTFTFTNPAPVSVTISSTTMSGPFLIVNNGCLGSVSYGGNCTIDVRFAPAASGPAAGNLTVAMSSGTASATLSGSGTLTPPATMTPPSLDFGTIVVGSPSAPGTFTISNPAATPLTLSAFTVTAPFLLQSTTCLSSMPPVATCEAVVKFLPSAAGPASGTISATAGFGTISSGLTGTGAVTAALQLAPTGHDFGTIPVGSSASKSFTVTNPAITLVTLSPPTATAPYQVASTTCTSSLPPSGTCVANVRFVPRAHGTVRGTLSVASSSGTPSATLVGTGQLEPALTMPSGAIDLGMLILGSAPGLHQVPLKNTGNAALSIDAISVGLPFTLTHDCPINLLPGESCVATITLDPTELGTFTASLSVLTNAPGGSRSVPVRGQVQPRPEPVIRVRPLSIGFGDRMAGTQAPEQRITVFNEGGSDAAALILSINTPHFFIVNTTCGNVLAPQSTCFANVAFQPSGFGPKRATLSVTSTAPTVGVSLSGAGCRPPQANLGRLPRLNCAP